MSVYQRRPRWVSRLAGWLLWSKMTARVPLPASLCVKLVGLQVGARPIPLLSPHDRGGPTHTYANAIDLLDTDTFEVELIARCPGREPWLPGVTKEAR